MKERTLIWLIIVAAAVAVLFAGLWQRDRARLTAYGDAHRAAQAIREAGYGLDRVTAVVSTHPRANVLGEADSSEAMERLNEKLAELPDDVRKRLFVQVKVRD